MASLFIRGRTYWIEVVRGGKKLRVSARTKDRGRAEAFLREFVCRLEGYVDEEWRRAVFADRQKRAGWQARSWRAMKERSARRKHDCMSPDELYALLLSSNGKCAITGLPVTLASPMKRDPFRASVDRIDPTKGYVEGNCRLVALIANVSLNAWGIEAVEAMASAIVARKLQHTSTTHVQTHSETINRRIER